MDLGLDNALEKTQSTYDDLVKGLERLFPQFRNATDVLVRELTKRVQELERKEERHKQKVKDFENRIDELQDQNRSLRKCKQDYDELKRASENQEHLLESCTRENSVLKDQNRQLSEQFRNAEHELANMRLKESDYISELNRQSEEYKTSLEFHKRSKDIEIANLAKEHEKQINGSKTTLQTALKRLENDIRKRDGIIEQRNQQIAELEKQLKLLPSKIFSQAVRSCNDQLANNNRIPVRSPTKRSKMPNEATVMRKAVEGSSLSSSSTSSSRTYSRPARHRSADLYEQNNKRSRNY